MYGTASKHKHDLVSRLGGSHIARSYEVLRRGGVVVAFGHATSLIRGGRLTGGRRSRIRGLPTVAAHIIRSRLIPDGKKVIPYSIQTLKRRHPNWYREDMSFLFDLLSTGALTPLVAGRIMLVVS